MKEEKFPNTRKPSHWQVCGEFWHLRGQLNREGKNLNKQTNKQTKHPQNTLLTATLRGEVAQMLLSTSSEQGLNREASVLHI